MLNILLLFSSLFIMQSSQPTFYERVAAKCNGEASFALHSCAATVRHRIEEGYTKENVLNAYYAPDVQFTELDVRKVKWVFDNPQWHPNVKGGKVYYMLGMGVDDWYRPHDRQYVLKICHAENDQLCVLFFDQ